MKKKYSLADAFVKEYTAPEAPKEKEQKKEKEQAPKEKEQKKEHKHRHHKHHKKHGHKHHHHHDDEEKDKKPDEKKSFLQLKDWDQDEDKEILESLKYAENKLGKKMATPHVLPKEHAFAPVKYDVEEMQTGQDMKLMKKDATIQQKADDVMGNCDLDDAECRKNSNA